MKEEKKKLKITLSEIISWFFGLFFLFVGLSTLFLGHHQTSLYYFMAFFFSFNPTYKVIEEMTKIEFSRGVRVLIVIILFVMAYSAELNVQEKNKIEEVKNYEYSSIINQNPEKNIEEIKKENTKNYDYEKIESREEKKNQENPVINLLENASYDIFTLYDKNISFDKDVVITKEELAINAGLIKSQICILVNKELKNKVEVDKDKIKIKKRNKLRFVAICGEYVADECNHQKPLSCIDEDTRKETVEELNIEEYKTYNHGCFFGTDAGDLVCFLFIGFNKEQKNANNQIKEKENDKNTQDQNTNKKEENNIEKIEKNDLNKDKSIDKNNDVVFDKNGVVRLGCFEYKLVGVWTTTKIGEFFGFGQYKDFYGVNTKGDTVFVVTKIKIKNICNRPKYHYNNIVLATSDYKIYEEDTEAKTALTIYVKPADCKELYSFYKLQPDVEKTYCFVFEVPTDKNILIMIEENGLDIFNNEEKAVAFIRINEIKEGENLFIKVI